MAKIIMIQGTMSDVGKSILVTGLCRIFWQDGLKTVPFKAQNMSSNAHVLPNGLSMSRAQAIQAEACGVEPVTLMNPVLLKPVSDMGAEVIVNGESRGVMSASDYFDIKQTLIPEIKRSFDTLASQNDVIVIEGAGSPAELNLKENDIVNMGLAKLVKAPVLLVGDINPGGVFAQIVGTLTLLDEDERNLVKGVIINKFRGDIKLLCTSLLEQRCGKPCLGVLPLIDMNIEAEDSLSTQKAPTTSPDKEYDKLADMMREHLNMKEIYSILETGA